VRGRHLEVRRPLFPGYVFAMFETPRDRVAVMSTRGVVSIVGQGQTPEPLTAETITQLQAIASAGPSAVTPAACTAGEAVTVARGPLAGLTGVVERTKGARRLIVTIALLNRACAVELGQAEVFRASPGCTPGR
jgi:transcription antitermination factor NusG